MPKISAYFFIQVDVFGSHRCTISCQHSRYSMQGQLRMNQMRLAMAVGDNRHYRIHNILPRHFLQSVIKAGMPRDAMLEIMEQLRIQMPLAIDTVCDALPPDFPEQLRDSISEGILSRLRLLE